MKAGKVQLLRCTLRRIRLWPSICQSFQTDPRTTARALPVGIVGELHVYGAHLPSLIDLNAWELGNCWLKR